MSLLGFVFPKEGSLLKVGLIMGSDSDFPVMKKAIAIFKEFGVEYEVLLASAHRTPAAVREFVSTAEERGISAFVVGAGMAAHLPGVVASYTTPGHGCAAGHRTDAVGHPRCDRRHQRCQERSAPGRTDRRCQRCGLSQEIQGLSRKHG